MTESKEKTEIEEFIATLEDYQPTVCDVSVNAEIGVHMFLLIDVDTR